MENLEQEIETLKQRVKKLEKKEKKRTSKETTKLIIKIVAIGGILFGLYRGYVYINNTFIKPVKETVEKVNNISDSITDNDIYNKLFGKKKKDE